METVKFEFKPVELEYQKPTEIRECFIEYNDKMIRYVLNFTSEEPMNREDPDMGWEESETVMDATIIKKCVAAVEKCYINVPGVWAVIISSKGVDGNLIIHLKKEKEAEALRKQLVEWLLNGC